MRRTIPLVLTLILLTVSARAQEATWGFAVTHAIGGTAYDVDPADLDGDGLPDIVAPSHADDGISVLMNDGSGGFGDHTLFPVANAIRSTAVGDFDGDGIPDVVAASGVQELWFLKGTGGGSFATPILTEETTYGGNAVSLVVADFDGDENLDVAAQARSALLVFLGNGEGGFTRTSAVGAYFGDAQRGGMAAVDLNGDGAPDLVAANGDNRVIVALNDGNGALAESSNLTTDFEGYDLAVGDFDGDGAPDVAVSGWGGASLLSNDGAGALTQVGTVGASGINWRIAAADVNLDGLTDLAFSAGSAGLDFAYGNGDGTFTPGSGASTGLSTTWGVAAADFNGDGRLDVVATDSDVLEGKLVVRRNLTEITAAAANDDTYETDQNATLSVPAPGVLGNDSGTGTLTAEKLTNPTNGEADILPDGTLTYNPAPDFTGTDSFTYGLTDGNGQTDQATVTITVIAVAPAVATDDAYAVTEGEALIVNAPGVLENDSGTGTLTATKLTDPSDGIVNLQSDGSFVYTPDSGFFGSDSFIYELADGNGQTDQATVAITVNEVLPPPLFISAGEEVGDDKAFIVRKRPGRTTFSHLATIAATEEGGEILLNLFEDVQAVAVQERVVWRGETRFTWYGRIVGSEQDQVILVVDLASNMATGTLTIAGNTFEIWPTGTDHEVREIDFAGYPEGDDTPDEEDTTAGKGEGGRAPMTPLAADQAEEPVIEMLVAYTDDVADSGANVQNLIDLYIDVANETFVNSGVNASVRLVGTVEVEYDETADGRKDRNRLRDPSDGYFDDVLTLRNQVGADVVALIVEDDGPKTCGVAFIMKKTDGSYQDRAMFVAQYDCLSNLTFSHELGHVMGARHDIGVDATKGSPYDYNHGYGNRDDRWRTVMAYNDACEPATCTVQKFWSDPDRTFDNPNNPSPGGPRGDADFADNTRVLNNTAPIVAGYSDNRTAQISGWVTFSPTGNGIPNIELDGFPEPVLTDADGNYSVIVPDGWSGHVRPTSELLVFDPPVVQYINVVDDQVDVYVAFERTISGYVLSSNGTGGIAGVLMDGFSDPVYTDYRGYYETIVPHEWSGIVTPVKGDLRFDPPQASIVNVTWPIEQNFTVVPPPTISGTVTDATTGQPVEGVSIFGFPSNVETDAAGFYEYQVDWRWSGTVTPLAFGYNFSPESRAYEDVLTDQPDQDYSAAPAVLADSDWPMVGRDPARTRAGSGRAASPVVRWSGKVDSCCGTAALATSVVLGSGGRVHVQNTHEEVFTFDPEGNVLWEKDWWDVRGTGRGMVAGAGGSVYAVHEDGIFVVEPTGRNHEWTALYEDTPLTTAPIVSEEDELLLLGTGPGDLIALDARDGTETWRRNLSGSTLTNIAMGDDGTIFAGVVDGTLVAVASDGTERWRTTLGTKPVSSVVLRQGGPVYTATRDGEVHAVDATSGVVQWTYDTAGSIRDDLAVGRDGLVYAASNSVLYALDGGTSARWTFDAGSTITTAPVSTTFRSPLSDLDPTILATETVIYVGLLNGDVLAVNGGGTFTRSVPGTRRWQLDVHYNSITDVVASGADRMLYATSGTRVYAIGEEPTSTGTGQLQLTTFGTTIDPDVLELKDDIHIIAALADEDGFGGILDFGNLPDDPCTGGPLFIPDCVDLASGYGMTTPLVDVTSDLELRIGFTEAGTAPEVLDGNLDGLLGTYVTVLQNGETYQAVLSGTTHPELLSLNPDGISTELAVFTAPSEVPEGDGTPVYAGHFSTDLSAAQLTLLGEQTYSFEALQYGEFSQIQLVQDGAYVAEIQILPLLAGKSGAAMERYYFPVSVGEGGGALEGVLLSGFAEPVEGLDLPPVGMTGTATGPSAASSARAQKEAARSVVEELLGSAEAGSEAAELLGHALLRIDLSLAADLWVDDVHLDPVRGSAVFNEEKHALQQLNELMEMAPGYTADARVAIYHLVVADLTLATVALGEAEAACTDGPCERELSKIRPRWNDGQALMAAEEFQRATTWYDKVWRDAQMLIDRAAKGDVESSVEVPTTEALEANYPNPFNPVTVIGYTLPGEADVRLEVFDVLGRRVAVLVDGPKGAGRHEVPFDAGELAGGVYLYRLTAGDRQVSKTMTLLK